MTCKNPPSFWNWDDWSFIEFKVITRIFIFILFILFVLGTQWPTQPRSCWKPQVKLGGKGPAGLFTCTPVYLNPESVMRSHGVIITCIEKWKQYDALTNLFHYKISTFICLEELSILWRFFL